MVDSIIINIGMYEKIIRMFNNGELKAHLKQVLYTASAFTRRYGKTIPRLTRLRQKTLPKYIENNQKPHGS